MDRTFRVLVAILIIVVVISGIIGGISVYSEMQYKNTFESVYSYECSIDTDTALENVKLFLPLPSGQTGNSEIGLMAGNKNIEGMPKEWKTEILGSDNYLMLEIKAERIEPASDKESINFVISAESKKEIDTKNPVKFSEVLRPIKNPVRIACVSDTNPNAQCYMYTGQIFASYNSRDSAKVSIIISLTGENKWKIFGIESNMFTDTQTVSITGDGKGWYDTEGTINAVIGSYR
jgi:hypothetical protein